MGFLYIIVLIMTFMKYQKRDCSISKADGGNENKRYLEVSGLLKSGYKISSFNFCGTKSECIRAIA